MIHSSAGERIVFFREALWRDMYCLSSIGLDGSFSYDIETYYSSDDHPFPEPKQDFSRRRLYNTARRISSWLSFTLSLNMSGEDPIIASKKQVFPHRRRERPLRQKKDRIPRRPY